MKYILIGSLLGSLITSEHETREACEGRAAMLREAKVIATCIAKPGDSASITYGSTLCTVNGCTLGAR